ncbi:MAG: flagellar hook-length control protein FliK [Alphaproteobacteria bacterium]|nr:flagellar hook-length control protein FliK [Alphaproteobacteria bacterium]
MQAIAELPPAPRAEDPKASPARDGAREKEQGLRFDEVLAAERHADEPQRPARKPETDRPRSDCRTENSPPAQPPSETNAPSEAQSDGETQAKGDVPEVAKAATDAPQTDGSVEAPGMAIEAAVPGVPIAENAPPAEPKAPEASDASPPTGEKASPETPAEAAAPDAAPAEETTPGLVLVPPGEADKAEATAPAVAAATPAGTPKTEESSFDPQEEAAPAARPVAAPKTAAPLDDETPAEDAGETKAAAQDAAPRRANPRPAAATPAVQGGSQAVAHASAQSNGQTAAQQAPAQPGAPASSAVAPAAGTAEAPARLPGSGERARAPEALSAPKEADGTANAQGAGSAPQSAQGTSAAQAQTVRLHPHAGQNAQAMHLLGLAIARQASDGRTHFQIRLDPPELGRIDVRLEFAADGRLHAALTADRPETLELLQRDARALEKSLADSGLKSDQGGLSFSLREEGRRAASGEGRPRFYRQLGPVEAAPGDMPAQEIWRTSRAGVDLRV